MHSVRLVSAHWEFLDNALTVSLTVARQLLGSALSASCERALRVPWEVLDSGLTVA